MIPWTTFATTWPCATREFRPESAPPGCWPMSGNPIVNLQSSIWNLGCGRAATRRSWPRFGRTSSTSALRLAGAAEANLSSRRIRCWTTDGHGRTQIDLWSLSSLRRDQGHAFSWPRPDGPSERRVLTWRPSGISFSGMSTPAPDAVKRLVDRFDQDRKVFLSGDYKEEQLPRIPLSLLRIARRGTIRWDGGPDRTCHRSSCSMRWPHSGMVGTSWWPRDSECLSSRLAESKMQTW